jgi:uncharacterized protein YchJ
MQGPSGRRRIAGLLVAGLMAVLAGCASGSAELRQPEREAIVKQRSQARWNALIADRLSEAYEYYSPASRSVLTLQDFIRSVRSGFWTNAQVDRVVCQSEDSCVVEVTIEYQIRGARTKAPVTETWIQTDKQWWYVKKG